MKNYMYASASIYGDKLDPEFWSKYFGITPNISIKKGDEFRVRDKLLRRRTGVWSRSTKGELCVNDALSHTNHMMRILGLPRDNLKNTLLEKEVEMRFFFYVNSYNKNDLSLPDDIKNLLDSCGIEVEFDIY